jgi:hypothetical protein
LQSLQNEANFPKEIQLVAGLQPAFNMPMKLLAARFAQMLV